MSTPQAFLSAAAEIPPWLALVREKVEDLAYGVVQIVVHDGKVTTIERTERTRVDATLVPAGAPHPRRTRS